MRSKEEKSPSQRQLECHPRPTRTSRIPHVNLTSRNPALAMLRKTPARGVKLLPANFIEQTHFHL
jgi:hypothetical protein